MRKIRWGVLGNAKIARVKVIPAMQHCEFAEVVAVASRDGGYGPYEKLLADPRIDAIYNPLPNHLHVPWSIRAAEAGKHVLCEKPIAMTAAEARELIAARDRTGVKVGEAFMSRTHPQWIRAREIARSGEIGEVRLVSGFFGYFNRDANNIRNKVEMGGGALMDLGCYPITHSRWIFGEEPLRVGASMERDPEFGTDRLTSAILDFPSGRCVFTVATQLVWYQRMHILGTKGRIEIEIPFNAPPDRPTRIFVNDSVEEFPVCDQYTIQADLFSRAILENGEVPVPLEDAEKNMRVIDRIRMAANERG
ncbi:MAG TPA: Gfo/Idh/MocA family oxidoreductase [Bryobacteraceae bacterium]|nr:Gfo/Idh/MocA family oxidoreductase [Bryobacteraceae bacterium]